MTDYIKKEDAIKAVANNYWHGTECECYAFAHKALDGIQSADVVPVVRCKDCKWYDPPHIEYNDGTRKDTTENDEWVTADIGLNVGGKCYNFAGEYCLSHGREDPDDYEELVKFRGLMDFCSNGERKEK